MDASGMQDQRTGGLAKGLFFSPTTLSRLCEIGAVAESSRYLAERMVEGIDFNNPGLIVELGPGLGAITRTIVGRAPDPSRILLLEVGKEFIPVLKDRFPQVRVRHDSAERIVRHVNRQQVNAIISGLPLRSLPYCTLKRIGRALMQVMNYETLYVQFTYDLRPNRDVYLPNVQMHKIYSKIVWRNLPPARVDVFCRVPKVLWRSRDVRLNLGTFPKTYMAPSLVAREVCSRRVGVASLLPPPPSLLVGPCDCGSGGGAPQRTNTG